ncbi:hypothetical protein SAMN02745121_00522 [Nannocystis exedens]|uniref:Uncharacterized protein n=1 Tax=Nannocystis exedens TaxID=54 RepID=A0A1I1T6R3_9BACT|nr:hypothetical protein [Nannocystis exedens]PCC66748.1 hypothetical protein NAEX_09343 [Nannocystis exedens]SFD54296.1 hypothetical protein SAMN02745121_00522 [Nannocystis exedens]
MALVDSSPTPMSLPAPHLNIVATCTERKRGEISSDLRLREIPPSDASARAAKWWARLDAAMPLLREPASRVYAGEHWKLVQDLSKQVRQAGWRVDLWIASAGYGLLSERTPINPYSCTFSEGSPDQVSLGHREDRVGYNQAWWSALGRLRQSSEGPTTLRGLAEESPRANYLFLCSPDYAKAMREDLVQALGCLRHPERLTIITSGAGWEHTPLRDNVLVIDARTQSAWGGTMQGLHARTALNLLKQPGALQTHFSTADLRAQYETLVADTPKPEKHDRARMTDEDVVSFIRGELAKEPKAGWTGLLRTLRASGRACEQRRFRRLHSEIAEEIRSGTTQ